MSRRDVWLILAALVSASVYLIFSSARGVIGFPLDDAWIHQVYARNLATRGEFAFFPSQPSAGSTSPLWTMLLAVGYVLRLDFRVWAFLLGVILLIASAFLISRLTFHISRFTFQVSGFKFQVSDLRPPSSVLRPPSSVIAS
ncbi:MAG: hypothetical protein N2559_16390, partial [Anaerolineae bacterium]|nr:hypothetical protein [Anaerolineae bacterium]